MNVHMVRAGLKPDRIQLSSITLNLSELRLGNPFFSKLFLPVPKSKLNNYGYNNFLESECIVLTDQWCSSIQYFTIDTV